MDHNDTNPASSVSSPDENNGDNYVIEFYDTDDPSNTTEDPTIEDQYELTKEEWEEFMDKIDGDGVVSLMIIPREEQIDALEEIVR